ncbi:MAG: hypothetical protein BRD48_07510 [Bacteroidetes bacterium QS_9_68_14]|nr:MAG: hypothetical protein BRD48_07510 [Bacteroidetes bacterium QS_9_68_14]
MKRFWHWTLGVLSALPLLSVLLLFLFFRLPPASLEALRPAGDISPTRYAGPVWGLQAVALGTALGFLLYLFYLVWTVRTPKFSTGVKTAWVVALSTAGLLVMPVLWWRYFRPRTGHPG